MQVPYEPNYRYIPPADWHLLTPLYDFLCTLVGLGKEFKRKVLKSIKIEEDQIILDIGCGTGIFLELAKTVYPHSSVIGIDPDEKALNIARQRLAKNAIRATLVKGYGESLPFGDESVDFCFSTLAFHHMPDQAKQKTIGEMYRVLKPGGKVIIADFGETHIFFVYLVLWFERFAYLRGNLQGYIPKLLEQRGFKGVGIVSKKFFVIHLVSAEK